ncbi:hypothetical protein [Glycomyces salinus]|uniref:hypothetical protein n=1 Tax=Glycomyces salinus TaxID=980294 RepID=UPI0018EE2481|nr:hypothetical protein [Glycomyces salinus]
MSGASHFGLTTANALATSANEHEISVEELFGQLRGLIQEMEADAEAMGGEALSKFRLAKNEFVTAYNELADKYGVSAFAQAETQNDGFNTDDANQAEFQNAEGGLPPIKPITVQI